MLTLNRIVKIRAITWYEKLSFEELRWRVNGAGMDTWFISILDMLLFMIKSWKILE